MKRRTNRREHGLASIEFAMVGLVFFVVLFGIFEVSRVLFTWNTLSEATRRGARQAVICPVNHAGITQAALFNNNNNVQNSILANMSPNHFKVDYLDQAGDLIAAPDSDYLSIRFVRVAIRPGIRFPLLIPALDKVLTLPEFATTLPVESMGVSRDDDTPQCSGSPS